MPVLHGGSRMSAHINADGQFQSDKYPTCPPGKVPLSVKDKTAQDLLWIYAQRRRAVDAEFSDDLEAALRAYGFNPAALGLADRIVREFFGDIDGSAYVLAMARAHRAIGTLEAATRPAGEME